MQPAKDLFDEALGFRLKRLRQARRISQEQLGIWLGVSFQQIQKYESGVNRMSPERIERCARIFEVPIAYFFGSADASLASFDKRVIALASAIAKLPSDDLQKRVYNLVMGISETIDQSAQQ